MICPYCGADASVCKDSRQRGLARNRTYACQSCGKSYYTKEQLLSNSARIEEAKEELQNTLNALRAAMRGAQGALTFLGTKEDNDD